MIPICRAPKRFVSALNKTRKPQRLVVLNPRSYLSTNPAILKPFKVNSEIKITPQFNDNSAISIPTFHSTNLSIDNIGSLYGERSQQWWTGKTPQQATYINGQPHSAPFLSLEPGKISRESLQAYFDNTWTLTEALFAGLQG